ncbi:phycobilisome rod-core linker polypeptide CpcG1 (Lrc) [Synechococcus sp. MEDNS5]|uniref:phycobilisome rod-core linker polypeptide n=1 Tax=Synechococcus sp. MEDNS5 TaxID=1442554 RepID=UPI000B709B26|nr:phycobilisome rod-core linker polypeptide [Synechococcus sp. MEDNS5]OUX73271.1 MAG: phycobilisome rod-core linker polypeptide CpcG [Synechococcus sp. TMED90]QNJ07077.1 phycobilisome rod-core linker polypeptide CpcG1 (Lrc) [Synechococcus sp. MEDNS5]
MALPLLQYAPTTQNNRVAAIRVASDENQRSRQMDISMDAENLTTVIESAYRQIFFHAFKSDRETFLESQLRNGQITVRDFIRGLCLSDTFKRSFYNLNSNYKVVRHLVEKVLGRKTHGKSEEIAWSIVIATKGVEGMVDALLDSEEYLNAFGYDTVPYQRNRVLPGRELGETPFNITTPRYDEYYRSILGFPQVVYTGIAKALPPRAKRIRGGFPEDYLPWVRGLSRATGASPSGSADIDYLSKVPYRSVGR